jgi:hypothetical protein
MNLKVTNPWKGGQDMNTQTTATKHVGFPELPNIYIYIYINS